MTKRTIILARHGSTNLNDDGDKIRGWRDIPLNAHGKRQAVDLGKSLKKEKFDVIISSNLSRAYDTAKTISKETGKPIVDATKSLRPWNLGKFTGMESKLAIEQVKPYVEKTPNKKIPDGESFNEFKKRSLTGIKKILEDYPNQTPLLVAHHRNDRLLDAWTKGQGGEQIDMPTFLSKGIPPGGYKVYHVYVT